MGPRGAAVPRLPFPLMQSPGNYPNPAPGWCRGTDVTARERGRGTRGRHGHKAGTGAVAPAHAAGTGTRGGAGGAVCSPSAAAPALPWRGTGAAGGSCGRWGARGTTGCLIMALPLAPPRVRHPDPCPAAAQGSAWTPPQHEGTLEPQTVTCGVALRSASGTSSTGAKSREKRVGSGRAAQRPTAPSSACGAASRDSMAPSLCSHLLATANHPGSLPAGTANHSFCPLLQRQTRSVVHRNQLAPALLSRVPLPSAPCAVPASAPCRPPRPRPCAGCRDDTPPSPCWRSAVSPFSTGRPPPAPDWRRRGERLCVRGSAAQPAARREAHGAALGANGSTQRKRLAEGGLLYWPLSPWLQVTHTGQLMAKNQYIQSVHINISNVHFIHE